MLPVGRHSPRKKGIMDRNRILELAIETLEKQKAVIDADIESIRAELKEAGSGTARKEKPFAASTRRRRSRKPAEHKSQSQRMKNYWAAKKLQAAKPSLPAKTSPASVKGKPMSAARKKALSLKMKAVWAKKRAEAAKKAQK